MGGCVLKSVDEYLGNTGGRLFRSGAHFCHCEELVDLAPAVAEYCDRVLRIALRCSVNEGDEAVV